MEQTRKNDRENLRPVDRKPSRLAVFVGAAVLTGGLAVLPVVVKCKEPPRKPGKALCASEVTESHRAMALKASVKQTVRAHGTELREALGAIHSDTEVLVSVSLDVDKRGKVGVRDVSATCLGHCSKAELNSAEVQAITGDLGVSGRSLDASVENCNLNIKVAVPRGK